MTDVRIAVELLSDAVRKRFDIAVLITGDADLVPSVTAVKDLFPEKKVIVYFPPERISEHLKKTASGWNISTGRRSCEPKCLW